MKKTTTELDRQINKYLNSIKKELPKNFPNRTQILHQLSEDILQFVNENPDCTFSDIQNEFGSVKEVSIALIDELPTDKIMTTYHKHKLFKWLLAAFLIFIIILLYLIIDVLTTDIYISDTIYIYSTEDLSTSYSTEDTLMED